MHKLKKTMNKIERIMSAISFAEEGEFQTAREILREDKRVLLALNETAIDNRTLVYALNAVKRVGAALDILLISGSSDIDLLVRKFTADLDNEGIEHRLIQKSGCLKDEIIDFTKRNNNILFVVVESSDNLDIDCKQKSRKFSETWRRLNRPLVVVMDGING